jgi:hypothetical protein
VVASPRARARAREDVRSSRLHRTRHLFIRQQTAVINSVRAHLAEFGIVAPVGRIAEMIGVQPDRSEREIADVRARGWITKVAEK